MMNPGNSDASQGKVTTENCTQRQLMAAILSVLRENAKDGRGPMTEQAIASDLYDFHDLHTPTVLRRLKFPDFAGFLQSDSCADYIKCNRDQHGTPLYIPAGRTSEPTASQTRAYQRPEEIGARFVPTAVNQQQPIASQTRAYQQPEEGGRRFVPTAVNQQQPIASQTRAYQQPEEGGRRFVPTAVNQQQPITIETSPVRSKNEGRQPRSRAARIWSDDDECDVQPQRQPYPVGGDVHPAVKSSVPRDPSRGVPQAVVRGPSRGQQKPKDKYTGKAPGIYTDSDQSDDGDETGGPGMDVRAMANITQRQPAHGPAHGEKFLQRLGEMNGGGTQRRVVEVSEDQRRGAVEEFMRVVRRQEQPKPAPSVETMVTATTRKGHELHVSKEILLTRLGKMIESVVQFFSPRVLLLADVFKMLSDLEMRFGKVENYADMGMGDEEFFCRYCKSLKLVKHGDYTFLHCDAADKEGEDGVALH